MFAFRKPRCLHSQSSSQTHSQKCRSLHTNIHGLSKRQNDKGAHSELCIACSHGTHAAPEQSDYQQQLPEATLLNAEVQMNQSMPQGQSISPTESEVQPVHDCEPQSAAAADDENVAYEYLDVRGKWMLDGCTSVQELASKILDEAVWYMKLQEDGWQLFEAFDKDIGQLRRPDPTADLGFPDDGSFAEFKIQELEQSSDDQPQVWMSDVPGQQFELLNQNADNHEADNDDDVSNEPVLQQDDGYERMRVYGRNMLDGCSTMQEVIERLLHEAKTFQQLSEEGWAVEVPVDNDRGVLFRRDPKHQ